MGGSAPYVNETELIHQGMEPSRRREQSLSLAQLHCRPDRAVHQTRKILESLGSGLL